MFIEDMYNGATVIAIEGGEGTGKGTLITQLQEIYPHALFIMEPGWGSKKAGKIRDEILSGNKRNDELIHLFALARQEVALRLNQEEPVSIIFTDRSILSSMVYQSFEYASMVDVLTYNQQEVDGFRLPNYTILLSGDVETIQASLHGSDRNKNWLDELPLDFHKEVDQKYRDLVTGLYGKSGLILDNTDLQHSFQPDEVVEWIQKMVFRQR